MLTTIARLAITTNVHVCTLALDHGNDYGMAHIPARPWSVYIEGTGTDGEPLPLPSGSEIEYFTTQADARAFMGQQVAALLSVHL